MFCSLAPYTCLYYTVVREDKGKVCFVHWHPTHAFITRLKTILSSKVGAPPNVHNHTSALSMASTERQHYLITLTFSHVLHHIGGGCG